MSITYSITGTSEKVTFNAEGLYGHPTLFDVSNSSVTSETITSSGAVNYVHLSDTGGAVTSLIFNGNTTFHSSWMAAGLVNQLNSINASADTGGVILNISAGTVKPTFTFTGGTGINCLMINMASLDMLKAGSQLNGGTATSGNMLALIGCGTLTGTSATTGEYKTLNATIGFQGFGIGGSGNDAVINDAFLTNGFATYIADGQEDGGSLTVINVGKTYTLDILGYPNPIPTNFTVSSAAGSKTALSVNIAPDSTSPTPLVGLTEGILSTTGGTITSVVLTSNTATSANSFTTYHGSDNQTITITGNNAFTIGSVIHNILTGDTINASGYTQALTLGTIGGFNAVATGAGDTGKGDVIKLGSGTSYLAVSSAVTGDKITLLAGHTATDTIDTTLIAFSLAATPYSSAAVQKTDITQINNFNLNSDILKGGIGSAHIAQNGTSTDLTGHTWLVTNGFVTSSGLTGATGLTAFLADVAASTTFAVNDVLAYNDGTNTYIAIGDHAPGTPRGEHLIELVGLHTATALGNAGGATSIDIASSMIPLQTAVTFNGVGSWGSPILDNVTDASVSETITSTGSTNYVHLGNTGGGITSFIINGNTPFHSSWMAAGLVNRLNSINASADTGGVTLHLIDNGAGTLKPTFTFIGGSGVDLLAIRKASLDSLISGSQLNGGTATSGNILAVHGLSTLTGTSASTGEYKTLNATKGFQILGVGGTGNNALINDAYLTNGFATHSLDTQDGGSLTVTNIGKTYTLDIYGSGNGINPYKSSSFSLGSAASIQTALTVTLTPVLQSPTLFAGVTVDNLTTTGGTITSIGLVSNAATSANTINTDHGSDNQTLTITGNGALSILGVTPNATKGDTINASGFAQALTLGTIGGTHAVATAAGDTGKGDVIKLGSGTSYITVSSFDKGDLITLLASHTAADTLDTTLIASHIAGVGGQYASAAAQKADITQITNFHTNSDILKVGIGGAIAPQNGIASDLTGHAWTVTNGFVTKAGLTGATGLTAFLADVAASTTFAANDMLAYNDGVNTYIAIGDHVAGTARGEHIVELVGLHTATALGIAGGVNTIHIA